MDERTLRVLEFPRIRERLRELTETVMGAELASSLHPSAEFERIQEALQETVEACVLLREGALPFHQVHDLRPHLARAVKGGTLEPQALLKVLQTVRTARLVKGFVLTRAERVPQLAAAVRNLETFEPLEAELERAIGEDGTVLDGASAELGRIRREIRAQEARLRSTLEEIIRSPRWVRMLQDPIVTVRGDRYVVPVKQQYVHLFPGILHDQSTSGATAFMEPLATLQVGNRIRALRGAEEREVQRFLARLSERVAAIAPALQEALRILGRLDFALAKARLADELDAVCPVLDPRPKLAFYEARHPLLVFARRADPTRSVVPIDVRVGEDFRTLVITGPNTGGKTVALKTIGLLQVMVQSGLLLPVRGGSRAGLFPQIFADIGDEQSIEQSLSTFSSHMGAQVEILRRARAGALVLLDEIGAGTDPAEGAALARAVIETLHERGCCVGVTTHYGELKTLAYEIPGVANASVEFDVETLRPTYRLRIGLAGRSHAFEIAERLGLDRSVLERARSYLREDLRAMDDVLAGMAMDQSRIEQARKEAERLREAAEAERRRYEALRAEVAQERERILQKAREEARALVERAQSEVRMLLETLRRERSAEAAERARRQLETLLTSLQQAIAPEEGEPVAEVEPGDRVRVASLRTEGTVVGIRDRGEVEVEVGRLRVRVPRSDLRAAPKARPARTAAPIRPAAAAAPARLELRGLVAEDAVYELEKALDAALLAGLPRLVVIHGKGTGALRQAVHTALAAHPEVRFRLAPPEEGGEGVTIVEFEP